ncbi:hypothetical protein P280DRAFT_97978 [Massarina eburnea CBS 473.64]|uniref:Uncharacterized protein n=1 Tax=Massarina eburnea CBS 473.64 TaxID=1395130 RepID=A0A6A6RRL0_9PLEO|nr:hypothetical protein P280DRAFT_97978 [Massarina eburnea CBS 473.64]
MASSSTNNRIYYSLPTQPPPMSRSGSRRPPLTPSTVSSPCLSTHAPVVTRRDSGTGSPTKASTLLAKVASHPPTPRNETPLASPMLSPVSGPGGMAFSERPGMWRSESARYVQQHRQQDGYISFPDFEKFCQQQNPYESQEREPAAAKT